MDPIAKIRRWHSKLNEGTTTHANVSYLLERIDELQRENERLQWRAVELSDEVRYLKGYAS